MTKIQFAFIVSLLCLVGCGGYIETPHGRGGVHIDDDYHNENHGRPQKHCPPGHAKKGWC